MKLLLILALFSLSAFSQESEPEIRELQEDHEVLEGSDITPLTPNDDRLLIDDVDLGNRVKGQEDPMEQEDNQIWRDEEGQDPYPGE